MVVKPKNIKFKLKSYLTITNVRISSNVKVNNKKYEKFD
jgi:hypothetical protein